MPCNPTRAHLQQQKPFSFVCGTLIVIPDYRKLQFRSDTLNWINSNLIQTQRSPFNLLLNGKSDQGCLAVDRFLIKLIGLCKTMECNTSKLLACPLVRRKLWSV